MAKEKEEKKAGLEQLLTKLLNDLLRMWWKPFEREDVEEIYEDIEWWWCIRVKCGKDYCFNNKSTREIVSKSSWLWQFVCENGMVEYHHYWGNTELERNEWYQYRLIESALCDEDKLEDFILENVKID